MRISSRFKLLVSEILTIAMVVSLVPAPALAEIRNELGFDDQPLVAVSDESDDGFEADDGEGVTEEDALEEVEEEAPLQLTSEVQSIGVDAMNDAEEPEVVPNFDPVYWAEVSYDGKTTYVRCGLGEDEEGESKSLFEDDMVFYGLGALELPNSAKLNLSGTPINDPSEDVSGIQIPFDDEDSGKNGFLTVNIKATAAVRYNSGGIELGIYPTVADGVDALSESERLEVVNWDTYAGIDVAPAFDEYLAFVVTAGPAATVGDGDDAVTARKVTITDDEGTPTDYYVVSRGQDSQRILARDVTIDGDTITNAASTHVEDLINVPAVLADAVSQTYGLSLASIADIAGMELSLNIGDLPRDDAGPAVQAIIDAGGLAFEVHPQVAIKKVGNTWTREVLVDSDDLSGGDFQFNLYCYDTNDSGKWANQAVIVKHFVGGGEDPTVVGHYVTDDGCYVCGVQNSEQVWIRGVKLSTFSPVTVELDRNVYAISDPIITVDIAGVPLTFTGSAQEPAITIHKGAATLVQGTDYEIVAYRNNTNAGTAFVDIAGKGAQYTGTRTEAFAIKKADMSDVTIDGLETSYDYTGSAIKPFDDTNVTLTLGTNPNAYTLQNERDYEVVYVNNVAPGTARVVLIGKGNFEGVVEKDFEIAVATGKTVEIPTFGDKVYDGSDQSITAPAEAKYTLSGVTTGKNAGTYTATATLNSGCVWADGTTAPKTITWKIAPKPVTLTVTDQSMAYNTTPEPGLTAAFGADEIANGDTIEFTLRREPGNTVGTYAINATLTSANANYDVTVVPGTFTITKKQIAVPTGKSGLTYNGASQAGVEAPDGCGYGLYNETGIDAGEYKAIAFLQDTDNTEWATGGTMPKVVTFTIGKKSVNYLTFEGIQNSYNATGFQIKPPVTVKDGEKVLVEGRDYTVTYGANTEIGAGTGTVTVTLAGNYEGTKTTDFNITAAPAVVAKIGEIGYPSLYEAIDAAEPGATIELVADDVNKSFTTDRLEVTIGKALTINGNGHTVYGVKSGYVDSLQSSHDLFISSTASDVTINDLRLTDFGSEYGVPYNTYPIWTSQAYDDNLTLNNVTIDKFGRTALNLCGGNVVIDGCTFTGNAAALEAANDDDYFQSGVESYKAEVTIRDTTITNMGARFSGEKDWQAACIKAGMVQDAFADSTGTITVESGTFQGENIIVIAEYIAGDGGIQVTGGTFDGEIFVETADGKGVDISGGNYSDYVLPKDCAAGKLCTTVPGFDGYYHIVDAMKVTFELDGGTYNGSTDAVERLVPKGEAIATADVPTPTKDDHALTGWDKLNEAYDLTTPVTADITLTANWAKQVARNERTEKVYGSLAEAVAKAKSHDTIVLLANETLGQQIETDKYLDIDLGGKTLTVNVEGGLTVRGDGEGNYGDVAFYNGTILGGSTGNPAVPVANILTADGGDIYLQENLTVTAGATALYATSAGTISLFGANVTVGTTDDPSSSIDAGVATGDHSSIYVSEGSVSFVGDQNADAATLHARNGGEVYISGGTINTANGYAVSATKLGDDTNGGIVEVAGGTIEGIVAAWKGNSRALINGGVIKGATYLDVPHSVIVNDGENTEADTAYVSISGGTLYGKLLDNNTANEDGSFDIVVSGGWFDQKVADGFVAAGMYATEALPEAPVADPPAQYTVVGPTKVAAPTATDHVFNGTEQTGVEADTSTPKRYTFTEESKPKATNVGTYTVVAQLASGYAWDDGSTADKQLTWSITPLDINTLALDGIASQVYTGSELTPDVALTDNGRQKVVDGTPQVDTHGDPIMGYKLVQGTDYTLAYERNIEQGLAKVTITGKDNYDGEIVTYFGINEADSSDVKMIVVDDELLYNAEAQEPQTIQLYDKRTESATQDDGYIQPAGSDKWYYQLVEGTDYSLTFLSNTEPGTATVIATLMGNYEGAVARPFKILAATAKTNDGKYFDSLASAVAYANNNASTVDTVTLLKDTTETVWSEVKEPVTIDLGGHEVSTVDVYYLIRTDLNDANGLVTIKNGSITSETYKAIDAVTGKVVLDKLTVKAAHSSLCLAENSEVEVIDSTIVSTDTNTQPVFLREGSPKITISGDTTIEGINARGHGEAIMVDNRTNATIIINSGTITGGATGIDVGWDADHAANADITVNGGTISGSLRGINFDKGANGSVIINGGTINASTVGTSPLNGGVGIRVVPEQTSANITINGGTINAGFAGIYVYDDANANVTVNGGTIACLEESTAGEGIYLGGNTEGTHPSLSVTGGKVVGGKYGIRLNRVYEDRMCEATISDGIVIARAADGITLEANNGATLTVSGGWFSNPVHDDYVAAGMFAVGPLPEETPDADAPHTVREMTTIVPPTLEADSFTYTGLEQTGVKAGTGYVLYDVTKVDPDAEPPVEATKFDGDAIKTDAGTYKIEARLLAGYRWNIGTEAEPVYSTRPQTINWTISKAPVTVTADSKTITYGTDYTPTATVEGLVNGETLPEGAYELSFKKGEEDVEDIPTAPGVYTINVGDGEYIAQVTNYDLDYESGTLTIEAATVDVPKAIEGLVYNGMEQTGVVIPDGAPIEFVDANDAPTQYKVTLSYSTGPSQTYTTDFIGTDVVTISFAQIAEFLGRETSDINSVSSSSPDINGSDSQVQVTVPFAVEGEEYFSVSAQNEDSSTSVITITVTCEEYVEPTTPSGDDVMLYTVTLTDINNNSEVYTITDIGPDIYITEYDLVNELELGPGQLENFAVSGPDLTLEGETACRCSVPFEGVGERTITIRQDGTDYVFAVKCDEGVPAQSVLTISSDDYPNINYTFASATNEVTFDLIILSEMIYVVGLRNGDDIDEADLPETLPAGVTFTIDDVNDIHTATVDASVVSTEQIVFPITLEESGTTTYAFNLVCTQAGSSQPGGGNGSGSVPSGVTGDKATNAGEYLAAVKLTDPGYTWPDGSTGIKTIPWSIAKADLRFAHIDDIATQYLGKYNKEEIAETTKVALDGILNREDGVLLRGTDYKVVILNGDDAGVATFRVLPIDADNEENLPVNFTGQASIQYAINRQTLGVEIDEIKDQVYTGSEIEPEFTVTAAATAEGQEPTELVLGEDYEIISWFNNVNVGTATVLVNLLGDYQGLLSRSFQIVGKSLLSEHIIINPEVLGSYTYTGEPIEPEFLVIDTRGTAETDDDYTLIKGVDYTLTYGNSLDPVNGNHTDSNVNTDSNATATITGLGNYATMSTNTVDGVDVTAPTAKTYPYIIEPREIPIPTAFDDLVYTGQEQEGIDAPLTDIAYTLTSEDEDARPGYGTDAGVYSVTASLKATDDNILNYRWQIPEDAQVPQVNYVTLTDVYNGKTLELMDDADTIETSMFEVFQAVKPDGFYRLISMDVLPDSRDAITVDGESGAVVVAGPFDGLKYLSLIYQDGDGANDPVSTIVSVAWESKPDPTYDTAPKVLTFEIAQKSIATAIIAPILNENYDGEAHEPKPEYVVLDGELLTEATFDEHDYYVSGDYRLEYVNNVEPGVATIIVHGVGNYTGVAATQFAINTNSTDAIIAPVDPQTYTGSAIEPEIVLYDQNRVVDEDGYQPEGYDEQFQILEDGVDYDVTQFINNVDAGTALFIVELKNGYQGTLVGQFAIERQQVNFEVVPAQDEYSFTGVAINAAYELVPLAPTTEIPEGFTYDVSYDNNIEAGSIASIIVEATGNYAGSAEGTFAIIPADVTLVAPELELEYGEEVPDAWDIVEVTGVVQGEPVAFEAAYVDPNPEQVVTNYCSVTFANTSQTTETYTTPSQTTGPFEITGEQLYAATGISTTNYVFDSFGDVSDGIFTDGNILRVFAPTDASAPRQVVMNAKNINDAEDTKTYTLSVTWNEEGDEQLIIDPTYKPTELGEYAIGISVDPTLNPNYNVSATNGKLTIVPADISNADVAVMPVYNTYTGKEIRPDLVVTLRDQVLVQDPASKTRNPVVYDYTVEWADNVDTGIASATIKGVNNYTGEKTVYFVINRNDVTATIAPIADEVYDGTEHTPDIVVYDSGNVVPAGEDAYTPEGQEPGAELSYQKLVEGTDYDVIDYYDDVFAGQATVVVLLKGNYEGTLIAHYNILPIDINTLTIAPIDDQVYTGEDIEPELVVKDGYQRLVEGVDYTVEYTDNRNAGTATATVTGIGNYAGERELHFTINKARVALPMAVTGLVYNGLPQQGVSYNYTPNAKYVVDPATIVHTDAGTYHTHFTLIDAANYLWADGSVEAERDVEWSIARKKIELPEANEGLVYTGNEQVGVDAPEEADSYTLTGNTATDAGTHYAIATLKNNNDKQNFEWPDGTVGPKQVAFTIARAKVLVPQAIKGLIYNGEEQTGVDAEYNDHCYTVEGHTGTNAGDYTAIATLNPNFVWPNGSIEPLEIAWKILPAKVKMPTAVAGLVYDGTEQTGVVEGANYTLEGNTATDAGDYTATATLTDLVNYIWSDGTNEALAIDWAIAKANLAFASIEPIGPQVFSGDPVTIPDDKLVVTVPGIEGTLVQGVDYTVSYTNNEQPGLATLTITATEDGNYVGRTWTHFAINAAASNIEIAPIDETFVYDGSEKLPTSLVVYDTATEVEEDGYVAQVPNPDFPDVEGAPEFLEKQFKVLVEGVDYEIISYSNNINVTDHAIVAIGLMGDYAGTAVQYYEIVAGDFVVGEIADQVYTSAEIEPEVVVRDATTGRRLEQGVDYELEFADNVNAGEDATATITGIGNYDGAEATASFVINKAKATIVADDVEVPFDVALTDPDAFVFTAVETGALGDDTFDYTLGLVDYFAHAGKYDIVVTLGDNPNYDIKTTNGTLTVTPDEIEIPTVIKGLSYNGLRQKGVDFDPLAKYTVSGIAAATAAGDYEATFTLNNVEFNNYVWAGLEGDEATAPITLAWSIAPVNIGTLRIGTLANEVFDGTAKEPEIVLVDKRDLANPDDDYQLVAGTDFTVVYTNNTEVGLAKAEITGIGNYTGRFATYFAILPVESYVEVEPIPDQEYTGEPIILTAEDPADDILKIFSGDRQLVRDTDYRIIAYFNNVEPGIATVAIMLLGNYSGMLMETFNIIPKKVDFSIAPIDPQTWTGEPIEPELSFVGDVPEDFTYEATYRNNKNLTTDDSKAEVSVVATGRYQNATGEPVTAEFEIVPIVIDEADEPYVLYEPFAEGGLVYNGKVQTGINRGKLEGVAYYIDGIDKAIDACNENDETDVYTAWAHLYQDKGYVWSDGTTADRRLDWTISKKVIDAPVVKELTFNGDEQIGVEAGEGYTLAGTTAATNVKTEGNYVATASCVKNYAWADDVVTDEHGIVTLEWNIKPLYMLHTYIEPVASQAYTGKPIEPTPKVTYRLLHRVVELVEGTDFTYEYVNNVESGVATIIARGMGNYEGVAAMQFAIYEGEVANLSISTVDSVVYDNRYHEPEVTVVSNGGTPDDVEDDTVLELGTDYTLVYINNKNIGTATVVATLEGNYAGSLTTTFEIVSVGYGEARKVAEVQEPSLYTKVNFSNNETANVGVRFHDLELTATNRYTNSFFRTGTFAVFNIMAPEGVDEQWLEDNWVTYRSDNTGWLGFESFNNYARTHGRYNLAGPYYYQHAIEVTEADIRAALAEGTNTLKRTVEFDWDGDFAYDQTFDVNIDVTNITLYDANGNMTLKVKDGIVVFPAIELEKPAENYIVEYDGEPHKIVDILEQAGVLSDGYDLEGDHSQLWGIQPGTRTVTATLQPGYAWSDGTDEPYEFTWTIVKHVAAPAVNEGLVYNSEEQLGVNDGEGYVLSGEISGITNNEYTAIATLLDGYAWADEEDEYADLEVKWTIARADVYVIAEDATRAYGLENPDLTAWYFGEYDDDEIVYDVTTKAVPGSDVGEYAIVPSGDEVQGNYNVIFQSGTLTITPRDINDANLELLVPNEYTGKPRPFGELTLKLGEDTEEEEAEVLTLAPLDAETGEGDFRVVYVHNVDVSNPEKANYAVAAMEGVGNFCETRIVRFEIVEPINKPDLQELIDTINMVDGVLVDVSDYNGFDLEPGTEYTTTDERQALLDERDEAQAVVDDLTSTHEDVAEALQELKDAIELYESQIKVAGAPVAEIVKLDEDGNPTDEYIARYATLADAVEAAEEGQIVRIIDDITLFEPVEIDKDLVLELNGQKIKSLYEPAIIVTGEDTVVSIVDSTEDALGTIESEASTGSDGSTAGTIVVADGADLSIGSGNIRGDWSAVYVDDGTLEIEGGYFYSKHDDGTRSDERTIAANPDNYEKGDIDITGGLFYRFDADHNNAAGPDSDLTPLGYYARQTADDPDVWEVVETTRVPLPEGQSLSFNGAIRTGVLCEPDDIFTIVDDTEEPIEYTAHARNADSYTARVVLKDPVRYTWLDADGEMIDSDTGYVDWEITPVNIEDLDIELIKTHPVTDDYYDTGEHIPFIVKATIEGNELINGKSVEYGEDYDYTVIYHDDVEPGTSRASIQGDNQNIIGVKVVTFEITEHPDKGDLIELNKDALEEIDILDNAYETHLMTDEEWDAFDPYAPGVAPGVYMAESAYNELVEEQAEAQAVIDNPQSSPQEVEDAYNELYDALSDAIARSVDTRDYDDLEDDIADGHEYQDTGNHGKPIKISDDDETELDGTPLEYFDKYMNSDDYDKLSDAIAAAEKALDDIRHDSRATQQDIEDAEQALEDAIAAAQAATKTYAKPFDGGTVTIPNYRYNGETIDPKGKGDVQVKLFDGQILKDEEYKISYAATGDGAQLKNNLPFESGTYTATIEPVDENYSGVLTKEFVVEDHWTRLWGQNGFDTMEAIVKADNESVFNAKTSTVVIASRSTWQDPLTATALAGLYGGPLLLVGNASAGVQKQTRDELSRIRPKKVIIVGNKTQIPESTLEEIGRIAGTSDVTRIDGKDAIARANNIMSSNNAWANTAIIATQRSYGDSLSVAPFAYKQKFPILFVGEGTSSDGGTLETSTINALKTKGIKNVIIVGGELSVSRKVVGQLSTIGISSVRWSGQTALDTSYEIAVRAIDEYGMSVKNIAIANYDGTSYIDALAGASLAGKQNSVLILVNGKKNNLAEACSAYNRMRDRIEGKLVIGHVLGGNLSIPEEHYEYIRTTQ